MFERCVLFQQAHLEIGRRYIQAFGLVQGVNAIVADMKEGRLSWEKAQQVLSHMHYLFIEYIVRRVGFTRFGAVLEDPEYLALQAESVLRDEQEQGGGPVPRERYARALESFAWNSLRHWHFVAHDLGGRNVYEITPKLARELRNAQPHEQPWKNPCLPVPALLLLVPPAANLFITLKGFTPREVTEIYVVESPPSEHQWAVWIHAPIDGYLNESVYLELSFSPGSTFEDGLASAHDMFQGDSPDIDGWRECVRWAGAAMRYVAEGGARHEFRPEEMESVRRVCIGVAEALQ
jgi:hypothetical protein